jgi:DNA gyrase subunit B
VRYLDRAKTPLIPAPDHDRRPSATASTVEAALTWNDSYHESMLCFTNNIPQRDGGTHLAGFRAALTRVVTKYAEDIRIGKKDKVALTGDDCREGLTCVLSVKVPDPKFSSQTKDKLVSSEVRPVVEGVVIEQLGHWFEEHPAEAKQSSARWSKPRRPRGGAQGARTDAPQGRARRRLAARQARRLPGTRSLQMRDLHRRGQFGRRQRQAGPQPRQPGRAAPARQGAERRARALRQDAVQRRDRHADHRARHRHRPRGIQPDKLRYHKIIIMTDADVDGAHIRTLLLTFFYRQMPELIERGHIYIAQPPLYKATRGKSERYLKDERELDQIIWSRRLGRRGLHAAHRRRRGRRRSRRADREGARGGGGAGRLPAHYPRFVLEQAAIAGALNPDILNDKAKARSGRDYIARRLDQLSDETERGWHGEPTPDGGLKFWREVRGVREAVAIDGAADRQRRCAQARQAWRR